VLLNVCEQRYIKPLSFKPSMKKAITMPSMGEVHPSSCWYSSQTFIFDFNYFNFL